MTEKDKESSRKSKAGSSTGKAKTIKKTVAKPVAARSKPAAGTKKKEPAEKATGTKPRASRAKATRVKPKSAEITAETSASGARLVQNVTPQLITPAPVRQEDPEGESALAEWASAAPERRNRLSRVAATRPPVARVKPIEPSPGSAELLDVPAWPELSEGTPTAPAPKIVVRSPAPSRPAPPPPPARQAPPPPARPAPPPPPPVWADEDDSFGPADEPEPVAAEVPEDESESDGQAADARSSEGARDGLQGEGQQGGEDQAPRKRRRRRRRGRHRNREQEQAGAEAAEAPAQQRRKEPPPQGRGGRDGAPARGAPARPEPVARADDEEPVDEDLPPIELTEELWDTEVTEEDAEALPPPDDKNGRLMLINVAEGEECRIAILHQNRLEELFIERASAESHVGNIYKGKVTNVEPSIQAAFVDFGLPKNGFLHISDLQPQYFPGGMRTVEEVGRKTPRRDRPPIQKCLRRGQEIIVQIIKEGIGTKGPTLTTYISIPGRYLVMMPGMNRLGVSRRIEDDDARRKMRSILDDLNLPKEMGFILRTAGLDRSKRELQQDLLYLQRLWKVVARRIKGERAPCELYRESDLVIRTIRDVFSPDFARIIVDDPRTSEKVKDFLSIAMPRSSAPVELYAGGRPLFHEYKLEQEIERINSRYVPLPSGGSLVIESTEALVAIDVNSGKYREHDDAEETAFRINIEAAEEIARQLRLRDLGGLILCDFIDMRAEKHRRGVERALRDALKKHKERAKCLRMSQFGIIEMTRQRMRPSIKRSIYRDCPNCRGTGLVKNSESMSLDIMRLVRLASHHDQVETIEIRVSPDVAFQVQNRKRAALFALEQETKCQIVIRADENLGPDQYAFECLDRRGGMVRMDDLPDTSRSFPEPRSKRRSGGSQQTRSADNGRETLEDVFD